tara:strand:+ start:364 stop:588 length:225 start_codon:yes stop_codon:yes gene_type:complete
MTNVNITQTKNTVTVNGETRVVTVQTRGPQGAKGLDLDESAKVDGSIIYYDASAQKYKADALETKLTLLDGGNF